MLTLQLAPLRAIEDSRDEHWQWNSLDNDPQFSLKGLENAQGRWVSLELEIASESQNGTAAVLYLDSGAGFNEIEKVQMFAAGHRAKAVFRVPSTLQAVRFDPMAQSGRFSIRHMRAYTLSKPRLGVLTVVDLAKRHRGQIPAAARKAWFVSRHHGVKALFGHMVTSFNRHNCQPRESGYQRWIKQFEVKPEAINSQTLAAHGPLISIIMPTYNSPREFLVQAIESVRAQTYPKWELCIADDASPQKHVAEIIRKYAMDDDRIKFRVRDRNGHISEATNSALDLASGEYVAFLDHDDLLHPLALHHMVEAIQASPGAGLIYSDEDKVDQRNTRFDPYFKCEFNYELMLAHNMICHFAVYRRSVVEAVGRLRKGYEGAQDYDLALRVIDALARNQIVHVPKVLYHWRAIAGSTALAADEKNYAAVAARKAVADHLRRAGIEGEVVPAPEAPAMNRVIFARPKAAPMVSIIIPTRDRAALLGMCLDSLFERTTYKNFELLIIDNGSVEAETFKLFDRLPKDRVRVIRDESPFNFSALNNLGAKHARGEYLCLMNNDIEILTPDWLEEMLSFATRPGIGAVGARLWYPDGRLQHGGVILGIGGVAGHAHKYTPKGAVGYFGRAVLHQSFSAVTAACLLISKRIFDEVQGLDEKLAVAFNDVDFCLRVRQAGYRNVWTPYAEMNHHESASRGHEDTPDKRARFNEEIRKMVDRWGGLLTGDPAYSPNLTLEHEDLSIA